MNEKIIENTKQSFTSLNHCTNEIKYPEEREREKKSIFGNFRIKNNNKKS